MTRERAIEIIRQYECNSEHYEACEMAIKALEQESTEMTAKEADNVKNSRLAIEAMHKQSCESYKFCKSCEDIAMAFQIGLLFGKADKAIEEVKKTVTPQPCDDAVSRRAVLDKMKERDEELSCICPKDIRGLPPVTPKPCEDCISRQAVLEQINCWIGSGEYKYTNATYYLTKRMQDLSSVSPKTKMGKWIRVTDKTGHLVWECDKCGWQQPFNTIYCPDCGSHNE